MRPDDAERGGDHEDWQRTRQWEREQERNEKREALIERYKAKIWREPPNMAEAVRLHGTEELGSVLVDMAQGLTVKSKRFCEALEPAVHAYACEIADYDLEEDN
jgi:hypothetical protein